LDVFVSEENEWRSPWHVERFVTDERGTRPIQQGRIECTCGCGVCGTWRASLTMAVRGEMFTLKVKEIPVLVKPMLPVM
jgi:hypothetical protein